GIANVDRRRDFTFPTHNKQDLKASPSSGASASFIDFIEKELQPFIHAHYKTSLQRTIIGESLGGLLATEMLMKRPGLFENYIIISPSLWWDDESLLKEGGRLLNRDHLNGIKVYVSVGNEGKQMVQDAGQLAAMIRKASPNGAKVFFYPFPNETHATIFHLSLYKAFEVLYQKAGK
ncbi:MAG: alpha/beta hydrolase, partial [Chitinophagales bacterium]